MEFFKTKVTDNVLIADFGNPKSANSFSLACAKELNHLVKQIESEGLGGLILTSSQKTFCSGGNLSDYAKLKSKKPGIEINKKIASILGKLEKSPFPTVCCVQGDCFGGGIELISAFDIVLSTPHSLFAFWQRKIGLSLGWGGGSRLLKRMSYKDLVGQMLSAECFSAYAAKDMGLIDGVFPRQLILEKALGQIKKQRDLPQVPLAKIKLSQIKNEQKLFESLWHNPEHQRLLSKFR